MNDQTLTRDSWPMPGKGGDCPAWTCDCCVQSWPSIKTACAGAETVPPRMIEVSGIRYFACSEACVRTLFLIHHQYALREMPAEGRFVHLSYNFGGPSTEYPVVLDLDAATKMAIMDEHRGGDRKENPEDEWIELRWWIADQQKHFGHSLPRRQAKEIIGLWRARPARSLLPGPKPEPATVM